MSLLVGCVLLQRGKTENEREQRFPISVNLVQNANFTPHTKINNTTTRFYMHNYMG